LAPFRASGRRPGGRAQPARAQTCLPRRLVRKPIVLYERDSWWLPERHVVLPEPAAYAAIVTRAPANTAAAKGRWMFLRL
jgi:hypothetical protein